jgi:arsenate reductase
MMSITIYHNPRCSKSRKTLELLEQSGVQPTIVEYLKTPPAADATLRHASLIGVRVADLLRRGEDEFRQADDLPDLDDDAALATWLEAHPKVIERPIVVDEENNRAVLGRPPENILGLIGK